MKRLVFAITLFLFFQMGLLAQQYVMLAKKPAETEKEVNVPVTAKAPVFEFDVYSKPGQESNIDPQIIENHFLGNEIAKKMYQLDKMYTYETKTAPGNPAATTSVRKPVIYNSVKKIESYLKKSVRKHEVSIEMATVQFNKVVDVALNTLYLNTDAFENQIRITGNTPELLELYTRQVHLNFDK
jgi:hypothetical protein